MSRSGSSNYERFRDLHERGGAFVMPNAWDGGSAALLAREGFEALGSTSLGLAFSLGRRDGARAVSREEAIQHAALLSRVSGLPVNGDLEDGFGPEPQDAATTVEAAIAAGLGGVGIEDTTADPNGPIHCFDAAVARVAAAARAARGRIVLTGRTDNYLHGRDDLGDTIRRLSAFADVGADVLYAPLLPDAEAISAVVAAVAPKPVNVLVDPSIAVSFSDFAALGVKRISIGGALYRVALTALADAGRSLRDGDLTAVAGAISGGEIANLLPKR